MTDVSVDGHLVPAMDQPYGPQVPSGFVPNPQPVYVMAPVSAPVATQAVATPVMEEHVQPDTPIEVSHDTTVVVETDRSTVREYALMFRQHLYNGGRKAVGTVAFLKGRLMEKSTYVFLGAGVAAASAIPSPWSYASMGLSIVAAMVPDHVIMDNHS